MDQLNFLWLYKACANVPEMYDEQEIIMAIDNYRRKNIVPAVSLVFRDNDGHTIWKYICQNRLERVATKLIKNYSNKIDPGQIINFKAGEIDCIYEGDFSGTLLMGFILFNMECAAEELISMYGSRCDPGFVNKEGSTALNMVCAYGLEKTALRLIKEFGLLCKLNQSVNDHTALMEAIVNMKNDNVSIALLKWFPSLQLIPDETTARAAMGDYHYDRYLKLKKQIIEKSVKTPNIISNTKAFCTALSRKNEAKAHEILDSGDIQLDYKDINEVPLVWACRFGLESVAIKILDKYGAAALPGYIGTYGTSALWWACTNKLQDVAVKLINTYGNKCVMFVDIHTCKSPYSVAVENNLVRVVESMTKNCDLTQMSDFIKHETEYVKRIRDKTDHTLTFGLLYDGPNGKHEINSYEQACCLCVEVLSAGDTENGNKILKIIKCLFG